MIDVSHLGIQMKGLFHLRRTRTGAIEICSGIHEFGDCCGHDLIESIVPINPAGTDRPSQAFQRPALPQGSGSGEDQLWD